MDECVGDLKNTHAQSRWIQMLGESVGLIEAFNTKGSHRHLSPARSLNL